MVRIAQQNDWVIIILVSCIFLYIFMLRSLQRDSSVLEFLLQKFSDASNNFLSWALIGVVYCLLLATAVSQFIPDVPGFVQDYHLFNFELNKYGFTFLVISIFYLLRTVLSYLLFAGTNAASRWEIFYFTAGKCYFIFSVLLMVLCVVQFYFPVDRAGLFSFSWVAFSVLFGFKLIYYLVHPSRILPQKWYYKILYICTLQIVPVLVLWKVLFV